MITRRLVKIRKLAKAMSRWSIRIPEPIVINDIFLQIWQHVKPQGISSADINVELKQGSGVVRLRLEFDSSAQPNLSHPSLEGDVQMRRSISIPSPSRFNLRGLRSNGDHDDLWVLWAPHSAWPVAQILSKIICTFVSRHIHLAKICLLIVH